MQDMSVVPRLLALGCLALTLRAYAEAQARSALGKFPSEATIENWLLGDDPRLVAWGAYDVLASRNTNLTADLVNLAVQWQTLASQDVNGNAIHLSREQVNKRDAMAAVLDALIQMDVPVPTETLRALAPDFPNAVAILLSRNNPEAAELLAFDFYRSLPPHGDGLQYVSAAILALHPPSGFAADLLEGIKVHADLYVVVPESPGFGFGGSWGACGLARSKPRTDWPPIAQYSLSKEKDDKSVLLVSGIDPIYAKHYESDTYRDPCDEISLGPYQRQQLIAEMLGISVDAISWSIHPTPTIVFQSDEQFSLEFLRFINEQEQKYRQTSIALGDRGLMSSAEAEQSAPKLEIYTNDMRGADATPLPRISPLPANVEWLNEPAWE